mgnify:CR=1 FL=1
MRKSCPKARLVRSVVEALTVPSNAIEGHLIFLFDYVRVNIDTLDGYSRIQLIFVGRWRFVALTDWLK